MSHVYVVHLNGRGITAYVEEHKRPWGEEDLQQALADLKSKDRTKVASALAWIRLNVREFAPLSEKVKPL